MSTVRSTLLGDLAVTPEMRFAFPAGVYGFPESREYALVPGAREGTWWLQSTTEAALAFLLVDPFLYFPGYAVDLPPVELAELCAGEGSDVAVLAIVTLPPNRAERPTANLQGPVAFNMKERIGRQVVLAESPWGVRAAFDLAAAG
jgi:flagellar assembly factor FliW